MNFLGWTPTETLCFVNRRSDLFRKFLARLRTILCYWKTFSRAKICLAVTNWRNPNTYQKQTGTKVPTFDPRLPVEKRTSQTCQVRSALGGSPRGECKNWPGPVWMGFRRGTFERHICAFFEAYKSPIYLRGENCLQNAHFYKQEGPVWKAL